MPAESTRDSRILTLRICSRYEISILGVSDEEEATQATENRSGLIDLISFLAYVARLNQKTPNVPFSAPRELGRLIDMDDARTSDILSFVLHIGMDFICVLSCSLGICDNA